MLLQARARVPIVTYIYQIVRRRAINVSENVLDEDLLFYN